MDVLWPNPPEEQLFVLAHLAEFERRGVRLVLGSPRGLEVFNDKQATYLLAEQLAIPVPRWKPARDWEQLCAGARDLGHPQNSVVFRQTTGKGGIGLVFISDQPGRAAHALFHEQTTCHTIPLASLQPILETCADWPKAIVCEYLAGREFEVDCFCSASGLQHAVVRQHHAMWGGTAVVADTVDRPDLVEQCRRLLASVAWRNICSVQFKEDANGAPRLIEVNPRMASNVALPVEAGVDLPMATLLSSLGRPVPSYPKPAIGIRSIRYLGQAFCAAEPK